MIAKLVTVNLTGTAASVVETIMRRTGWDVDQALAHVFLETDTSVTPSSHAPLDGVKVGVQVTGSNLSAHPFDVGAMVRVISPNPIEGHRHPKVSLFGRVTGYAPQGVEITLTDRSVQGYSELGGYVNKVDLWDLSSVTAL